LGGIKDWNEGNCARNRQERFLVHHKIYRHHQIRLDDVEYHFLQPQQACLVATVHMNVSSLHGNH